MKHHEKNKNNNDIKKNNKKGKTDHTISNQDTAKQVLDAVSPSRHETSVGYLDSTLGQTLCIIQTSNFIELQGIITIQRKRHIETKELVCNRLLVIIAQALVLQ